MNILGIAGSLRQESYNKKLLTAALAFAQVGGNNISIADIGQIPLYNEDVENAGLPESVIALKAMIEPAHLLVIASPEYNHSIPGVLKNALDWATRPERAPNVFEDKVAVILGASSGKYGTARMQPDLKKVLAKVGVIVVPAPVVYVGPAAEQFDSDGALTDPRTRQQVEHLVQKGMEMARKLG